MDKYEAQRLGTNSDAQSVLENEIGEFFPQLEAEQEISAEVIGQFYDWQFPFAYTQDGGGARRWRASVRAVCRRNKKLQQLEELFESSGTDGTLKEVYSGQDEDEYTDNHATRTKTEFAGVGTTTSENLGDTTTNEPVDGKNNTTTVRKKGTTRTYADGRTWTQILKDVGAAVDPVDEFINAFAQVLLPPCEEPCCPLPPSVSMTVEVEELPTGTPPTAKIVNKGTSLAADWLLSLGVPNGAQGEKGEKGEKGDGIPDGGTPGQFIQKTESGTEWADLYAVGDYFISDSETSPAQKYGGSWEQITDRFLVGAGGRYALDSTGGNATHTNTVDEMAPHNHGLPVVNGEGGYMPANSAELRSFQIEAGTNNNQMNINGTATDRDPTGFSGSVGSTGGGQPFSILPPYIAVNIWRRVA